MCQNIPPMEVLRSSLFHDLTTTQKGALVALAVKLDEVGDGRLPDEDLRKNILYRKPFEDLVSKLIRYGLGDRDERGHFVRAGIFAPSLETDEAEETRDQAETEGAERSVVAIRRQIERDARKFVRAELAALGLGAPQTGEQTSREERTKEEEEANKPDEVFAQVANMEATPHIRERASESDPTLIRSESESKTTVLDSESDSDSDSAPSRSDAKPPVAERRQSADPPHVSPFLEIRDALDIPKTQAFESLMTEGVAPAVLAEAASRIRHTWQRSKDPKKGKAPPYWKVEYLRAVVANVREEQPELQTSLALPHMAPDLASAAKPAAESPAGVMRPPVARPADTGSAAKPAFLGKRLGAGGRIL